MRAPLPTALALLLLAATVAHPQDAEEWDRDVAALAPGEDTATALIVDRLTHRPVPGARLTWYAEMEGLRAPALGVAVADARGLATLDWTEIATWDADGHFLVTAEGYAATHEYGRFPPTEIELARGRDVTARILDRLGRPVADADVEVFLGCGHGPILDLVRTDAEGRFTVRGQDASQALLWIEHPGVEADYLELSDATVLGAGEGVLLLAPGVIAEGVILDSAGRPLEGVEVRSFQRHRGPVALTDRRGRFRLLGVENGASLSVAHPHAVNGSAVLESDRWQPGVPMRLYLTPWGFAVDTQERVEVDVHVLGADGPDIEADIDLARDGDGLVYYAEPTDDERSDVLRFVVPPGIYVPRGAYAFGPWEIEPLPIEARPGAPVRVTLRARPRPRLALVGDIPDGAQTSVAVEGLAATGLDDLLDPGGAERVPSEAPVVVAVTWLGRTWFFPAGREDGGVRVASVEIPEPHRLLVPDDLHGEFELLHDGVRCEIESVDGGFATYAWGDLVLRVDTGDALLSIDVTLPESPGTEVAVVRPQESGARILRLIPPDGPGVRMRISIAPESGGEHGIDGVVDGPVDTPVSGPALVRVERDDHVVWSRRVDGPGDVHFAWGDAALAFHVVDDGGDNVRTAVLVDGVLVPQRPPDELSVVRVLGLEPGPHTVLLLPSDDAFLAKELRVVLAPGETRRRRIELAPR